MPVKNINTVEEINLDEATSKLVEKANNVHLERFGNKASFGRCIFLSWYCSLGNCDFCYRSTQKQKIVNPALARRRRESLYTEALIAKKLDWNLEFLTGGYGIFPFKDLLDISKDMNNIFKEKVWLNLGVLSKSQLEEIKPYVEGVVASIETLEPKLAKKVAPGKPLKPFEDMLVNAKEMGLKTSMTIILGLGEPFEDYENYVKGFITKHGLDRITYYALRPVKGTPYSQGPSPEYVAKWVASTRVDFPSIEIAVGTAETRIPEISLLLRSGANIITKLPATRLFGTTGGVKINEEFDKAKRINTSNFLTLPKVDWKAEIKEAKIPVKYEEKVYEKLVEYEEKRLKSSYLNFKSISCEPCGD